MSDNKKEEKDFFEKFDLSTDWQDVKNLKLGEVYPLYGMVTNIEDYNPDTFKIIINHNVHGKIFCQDRARLELIKERAFEPAIFMTKIEEIQEGEIYATIQTIIFGKKQTTAIC